MFVCRAKSKLKLVKSRQVTEVVKAQTSLWVCQLSSHESEIDVDVIRGSYPGNSLGTWQDEENTPPTLTRTIPNGIHQSGGNRVFQMET
ncbi:hypothetical protein DAPPUDRAFT_241037 [Daphnia pulex]|uniref:Uncharacterized protein n=1 Tax=Daphnia pulex TaxID=6669 RepID=E9GD90_DAPPU|nr:hypothetical protein DAPPUDRAFT_241037 [Daphnia pulex]|eukprot:EFX82735.1 hypothetical protein DAPPUDRAFT_241037 [Daphnia pulex]